MCPAFAYHKHGTLLPLTYPVFSNKLEVSLDKCGIDSTSTLDTPLEEEVPCLHKPVVLLGTISSFKVTGPHMLMNVI